MKLILILIVGIIIGYAYGFKDAQTHRDHVVARLVGGIGGASRENVKGNIDKQIESADPSKPCPRR